MADQEDVELTIDSQSKLDVEKVRDPRPSVWLSVFKWLFAILLSVMLLTCVVASKLSLLSIGSFYNSTRNPCSFSTNVEYSKETTFIMMVLVLMIPQFVTFLRACRDSLCSEIHPWPTKAAIAWTVLASLLEVFGVSFFTVVIILKTTLSAAHCVVIMNCVFLCPIVWQIIRLKPIFQTSKLSSVFVVLSGLLELCGIVTLSYDVIKNKPNVNLVESIGILVSLFVISVAWSNKMQRMQIEPRINENESILTNEKAESTESLKDNSQTMIREETEEDILYKETARDKSTFISGLVKIITTPFVAALFCHTFDVADLTKLDGGFENFTANHPAFSHFMAQIFTSFVGNILGWVACAMCMQRIAFFLPMLFATPISILLISVSGMCCTSAIPFKCADFNDILLIVMAVCLWLAQVLSTSVYLWKEQTFIMAKESSLFWIPVYNDAFLEQNLLLNRKNQITDESQINQPDIAKKSCVYICTTMYHENESEMEQLLKSLHDVDTAREGSRRRFESHVFFDGAVKEDVLGDFVLQLIALIPKTLHVKIKKCMKIKTPYGMQLRWRLPGGMPFHIHLKDNSKVKNKKRWSQAMYMSYVLDYKEKIMESDDDNTYILATDADVKFTHESVQALLDLMMRDRKVGAVCGRTHPLGSGPVVWYQIFDYAIGHWFQKVANHVLGSVLCSPGCFSVYRARAIRDVLPIYASGVNTSIDFLTKDMGEDRWMCTLMVQSGWRLEYCAAAEDSTFCPDSFNEFFNQRRRWIPSTLVNLIQVISNWKVTVENNDKISIFFILYQALLVASTLISPATVILVIIGALKYSSLPGSDNELAVMIMLLIITFGFGLICLYTKQSFQLKVAKILTIFFALLMSAVTVGMAAQIGKDLAKRSECDEMRSTLSPSSLMTSTTLSPTTLPVECTDGLPADLSSLYLAGLVGIFFAAALLHPSEAFCLVHGVWYLCCLPSGYLLLIIYSLANITDRSWGTRETKEKKVGDDVPWYIAFWEKLRSFCFCCRDEKPDSPAEIPDVEQPEEDASSDDIIPDEHENAVPSVDDSSDKSESKTESASSRPLPAPRSILRTKIQRPQGTVKRLNFNGPFDEQSVSWRFPGDRKSVSWRFPGDRKSVQFSTTLERMYTEMSIEDWLPHDLKTLYLKNFVDNGYDNVSFVIGMADKDLRSIGINKRGHRSQILYLIKNIPHNPPNTDVPENIEDWLNSLGLEMYWTSFKENGYIEPRMLEDLKAMNNDTLRETLETELNIHKVGHMVKITNAIKNLQYATPAQRKIREARELVSTVKIVDIQADNGDDGREYRFWTKLRTRCLLPESLVFGTVTELKEKLEELRDSVLTVFAVANVMWIIIIMTLEKQTELKVKGINPIGLAFLAIYGLVIVIQFLTMIWHRMLSLCHLLARAPWRRGPYQMLWSFKDEYLVPEPTKVELDQIRVAREKRISKRISRRTKRKPGRYLPAGEAVRMNPIAEEINPHTA